MLLKKLDPDSYELVRQLVELLIAKKPFIKAEKLTFTAYALINTKTKRLIKVKNGKLSLTKKCIKLLAD